MADPRSEGNATNFEPIKATRGVPFLLFPPDRPIPLHQWTFKSRNGDMLMHDIMQTVDIQDLGKAYFHFAGGSFFGVSHKEDLEDDLKKGRRIVICSASGPVEVTENTSSARKVMGVESKGFNLSHIELPEPLDVVVYFPRFEAIWEQKLFHKIKYGVSSRDMSPSDNIGELYTLLIPDTPELLNQIRAKIG
ncbi:MAG TPA: hypothetical protein VLE91_02370 [Candidatus Saccharimonadales bacterium]|nr:hypothetical protein [Candidatus Saccharimonadales bacterium]